MRDKILEVFSNPTVALLLKLLTYIALLWLKKKRVCVCTFVFGVRCW